jgi:hypothetical protein
MTNEAAGKVALMFLTMGDHAQPDIWKAFLSGHTHQFNIYCHPYFPKANDTIRPDGASLITQTSFLYNHVIPKRAHTR